MNFPIKALLLCGTLFTVAGCAPSNNVVENVGGDRLREFAVAAKSVQTETSEIPRSAWPDGMEESEVKAVRYYIDGVMIVTSQTDCTSKGLFVGWNDDPPCDGSGIEFDAMEPRIYGYVEKIRQVTRTSATKER